MINLFVKSRNSLLNLKINNIRNAIGKLWIEKFGLNEKYYYKKMSTNFILKKYELINYNLKLIHFLKNIIRFKLKTI